MKSLLICLALLCSSIWAGAQSSSPHKDPTLFLPSTNPGEGIVSTKSDPQELERETQQPARPAASRSVDLARIKQDSDELSRLSQLVSSEISASERGTLPKDLSENLKKIEKLSKRLRDELKF